MSSRIKRAATAIWLCGLLLCIRINAQTIFGINGLVKTPDAYIIEKGKANIGVGNFKDEYYKLEPGLLHSQWGVTGNFGFHSRFDLGFRVTNTPDIPENDTSYQYSTVIDRSLNVKLLVFKEHRFLPQLAVGAQYLLGTHMFNATYIAVSKKLNPSKALTLAVTAGYGFELFTDAGNHRYAGPFGGIELTHTYFYLTGEYIDEHKEFCGGIGLKFKALARLRFISTNSFKEFGGQLSFTFRI